MKFDKKSIVSILITSCIIFLITYLVILCDCEYKKCQKCIKEGLQFYGNEKDDLEAPLPYRTVMENIKYPVSKTETSSPIYDTSDKIYNSRLFNKINTQLHFSDEEVMKDMKYFNNSTNLLLEHYLNNNVPYPVKINIQDMKGTVDSDEILEESDISSVDYYPNINFKSETIDESPPSYLYDLSDDISKEKTYIYRLDLDKTRNSDKPPTNGLYLVKDVTKINGDIEENNIYNYDYKLSGMKYDDVYTQLTKYDDSSFNSVVSMTKPGKYSSHYFESNYSDISDNVTKDFKYFYSTAPTMAGYGLFNKR